MNQKESASIVKLSKHQTNTFVWRNEESKNREDEAYEEGPLSK